MIFYCYFLVGIIYMTDTILMFLITSISAIMGAIIKTIYDSKCKKCKIGCIEIERDIQAEVELEEHKEGHNEIHREA